MDETKRKYKLDIKLEKLKSSINIKKQIIIIM